MVLFWTAAAFLAFAVMCELAGYWHLRQARKLERAGLTACKPKYEAVEGSRVQSTIWVALAMIFVTTGFIEAMWRPPVVEPVLAFAVSVAVIVGVCLHKAQCWRNKRSGVNY